MSELFCLSNSLGSQCESIIKPPLTGQELIGQPFPSPEREQTDLLVKGDCFAQVTYSLFGLPWIISAWLMYRSLTPLQTGCLATMSFNA